MFSAVPGFGRVTVDCKSVDHSPTSSKLLPCIPPFPERSLFQEAVRVCSSSRAAHIYPCCAPIDFTEYFFLLMPRSWN